MVYGPGCGITAPSIHQGRYSVYITVTFERNNDLHDGKMLLVAGAADREGFQC